MSKVRAILVLAFCAACVHAQAVSVFGSEGMRRWHRVTLELRGPRASEGATPNPFFDYRMIVTFTHTGRGLRYRVPGYFAADGDAAESSAVAGDRWRAHLCPDHTGTWRYSISFRRGSGIAISDDPAAGAALAPFDGVSGTFVVGETEKAGRDHRARGRLRYVGEHHLRFADGTFFLKVGADSPENLLAYADFDNTPDVGNRRKSWQPHVRDWRSGDPAWKSGRGKGLVGAINYLAGKGMNVMSFLTYSYNGDDKNVFPYADPRDRRRFDCSKLDQWEIVFEHMDRRGIYLHFKTQETENDQDMDGGALGPERRLYYRELIARFGHHLALNWNLGEENTNTTSQRREFARYFADHDPYRHLVVVHTYPGAKNNVYGPLLGTGSLLTGASLQSNPSSVFQDTLTWRTRSAAAGRRWVVANDEQGSARVGIKPDADDPRHDSVRRDVLWGNLMAGGAGIECYFGYSFAHSDLTCQDFRSRDLWWNQCRHARELFERNGVPFWRMANRDALVASGRCLASRDQFVVYLPNGGSTTLDLTGLLGAFEVAWFDPRSGGSLQAGSVRRVQGNATRSLGNPPSAPQLDWVVVVRGEGRAPPARLLPYGAACRGSNGLPAMGGDGLPRLGNRAFATRVANVRPVTAVAMLVSGRRGRLSLPGGCTLWIDRAIAFPVVSNTGGVARLPLPIPQQRDLAGYSLFSSAVVFDPNGAWGNILALANGLEIAIGQ